MRGHGQKAAPAARTRQATAATSTGGRRGGDPAGWLAVGFAAGIGLYFALPVEPPLWVGFLGLTGGVALLLAVVGLGRRIRLPAWIGTAPLLLAGAGGMLAAGFLAAQVRAAVVAAPVLRTAVGPVTVDGRVAALEPNGGQWRLYLDRISLDRPLPRRATAHGQPPERIRLSLASAEGLVSGQRIRLRARLLPPPEPVLPGGYDLGRALYFDGIGALGFAVTRPEILQPPDRGVMAGLDDLRATITQTLRRGIGGAAGDVAAALVTGVQGAVPESVEEAYRDSGLAHILSISGLHMALVGGLVYVGGRMAWALVPWLALRVDGRRVMAPLAIAATALYLLLSGGSVPAVRSFIMTLVVFAAVLMGRSALTLRTLAVAALLILALRPEALVGPSFQLSFAAVAALIAAYAGLGARLSSWRAEARGGWDAAARAAAVYVGGILLSTLVAGLATAPVAAYHFHRFTLWSVAANLLAVPVVSLWVMPWLVIALLLMPLGLEAIAWGPLRVGLDAVAAIAAMVAGWPAAVLRVPPFPLWALVAMSLGGLWLVLTPGRWRWAGAGVMILLLPLPWLIARPPDLLVSADGSPVAVRQGDGLVLRPGRGDAFTRAVWREAWGDGAGAWTTSGLEGNAGPGPAVRCDPLGCLIDSGQHAVLLAFHPAAAAEDCGVVTVIISAQPLDRHLCSRGRVIDRWELARGGTHALTLTAQGPVLSTVAAARGRRPWTVDGTSGTNHDITPPKDREGLTE